MTDTMALRAEFVDRGVVRIDAAFDLEVPIDVLELRGAPGDVVITHLHVFHSPSPNTGRRPREMVANTLLRAPTPPSAGGVVE